jgi:hypothetical protein
MIYLVKMVMFQFPHGFRKANRPIRIRCSRSLNQSLKGWRWLRDWEPWEPSGNPLGTLWEPWEPRGAWLRRCFSCGSTYFEWNNGVTKINGKDDYVRLDWLSVTCHSAIQNFCEYRYPVQTRLTTWYRTIVSTPIKTPPNSHSMSWKGFPQVTQNSTGICSGLKGLWATLFSVTLRWTYKMIWKIPILKR